MEVDFLMFEWSGFLIVGLVTGEAIDLLEAVPHSIKMREPGYGLRVFENLFNQRSACVLIST